MTVSTIAGTLISFADFQSRLLKQQDQWLAAHGISYREFLIMYHLKRSSSGTLRRVDLAEKVGLTASGITRMLNPMEKIGLVAKEAGARDARVSLVRLSTAGETVLAEAEASFSQRARAFVSGLTHEQKSALEVLSTARI